MASRRSYDLSSSRTSSSSYSSPRADPLRSYDYSLDSSSSRTTSKTSSSSTTTSASRPSILESTYTTRRPTELEKWEYDLASRRAERELRDVRDGHSTSASTAGLGLSSTGSRLLDTSSIVGLPDAHRGYSIRSPAGDVSYSYDRHSYGRPGAAGGATVEETRTSTTRTYRS